MDFIVDLFNSFSEAISGHIDFMAMALTVSILIIYGMGFNGFVKSKLAGMNRILRWLIFTSICIFVYGMILKLGTVLFTALLKQFNNDFLAPVALVMFLTLGFFAEKHNR